MGTQRNTSIFGERFAFACLLLGTSALVAPAALAQSDEEGSAATTDRVLDTVTVTSTRREENILDVPYNISAISGADIEGAITLDTAELLRSVPGVSLIDQGPRNGAQFNSIRIRGLNVDSSALGDFAVPSVATVSTYVNETPVFANIALIDLERVEVLRGPQGTLYGSGALGGTVKYLVNPPTLGEVEGRVGTTVSKVDGSDSWGWAHSGVLNVPVGDKFALRFNALIQDYPGITDYTNLYVLDENGVPVAPNGLFARGFDSTEYRTLKDADTFESTYFRASARWEPTTNTDFTFNWFSQDDDTGGRRSPSLGTNGVGEPYGEYENGAVIEEPSEREFDMASLEANIDFGFATLTSATSYYENEGSTDSDNTGFYANSFPQYYYFMPRPLYTAERTFGDEAFIQELRLVSPGDRFVEYTIGAFYQEQTRSITQVSDLVGFEAFADALFPPIDFVSTDNVFTYEREEDFTELALFGELTLNLTDDLSVTGGARYFDNEADVSTFTRTGAYDSVADEVSTPFSSSEDDVLFKLTVGYEFSDDDLFFASVSEGYRRGGNNGVPTIGDFFANDPAWQVYNSDSVTNYEAGIKGTFLGQRYDASVFMIDWQDPQFNTSAPNGAFFAVVNGEEAETSGFELQLSGPLGESLGYGIGYAYVDAELSEALFEPPTLDTGTGISSDPVFVAGAGSPLPGIPEHSINLAVDYFKPITDELSFIGRIDGFYQSETQNVLDPGVSQSIEFDGFAIWDLTATLQHNQLSTSFFVKNIANEEGTTGAFSEGAFGPNVNLALPLSSAEFYGSNSRSFIALPRTIGVSVNYNF